jgi:hypothetical protein
MSTVKGEYRGIKFEHEYSINDDDRIGIVHFPSPHGTEKIRTTGAGAAGWEDKVRDPIDDFFRETRNNGDK